MNRQKTVVFMSVVCFALACFLLVCAGCGGGGDKADSAKKSGKKADKPSGVAVPTQQGPFDDGRLIFSTPKKWNIQPRNSSSIVWFRTEKSFPNFYVMAKDAPADVAELTPANAAQYVPELKDVKAEVKAAKKGAYSGVFFEKRSRGNTYDYASVYFSTIQVGRIYTFELRVIKELLSDKTYATLDAVVASAKFSDVNMVMASPEDDPVSDFSSDMDFGAATDDSDFFGPVASDAPEE